MGDRGGGPAGLAQTCLPPVRAAITASGMSSNVGRGNGPTGPIMYLAINSFAWKMRTCRVWQPGPEPGKQRVWAAHAWAPCILVPLLPRQYHASAGFAMPIGAPASLSQPGRGVR